MTGIEKIKRIIFFYFFFQVLYIYSCFILKYNNKKKINRTYLYTHIYIYREREKEGIYPASII